ncbi:YncE family protein, partial [Xenorhabdus sp. 42]
TLQSFVNLFRILTTIVSTFDSLDLTQKTQSLVFLQEFQLIVSQSLLCLICPHPFAYITNFYSDNVSVIDVETNKVITIIPVGKHPSDVAITPDRQFVYVTNLTSKNISVINTETNSVIATIPVGGQPYGIAITPNG